MQSELATTQLFPHPGPSILIFQETGYLPEAEIIVKAKTEAGEISEEQIQKKLQWKSKMFRSHRV